MITKINRNKCYRLFPKLPWHIPYRYKYFFPEIYRGYIVTLQSKTVKSHAKNISAAFQLLIKNMGFERLVFIGDSTLPWLFREDKYDYKQVVDAFEWLKAGKVSRTFNGGLLVGADNIAECSKHLFWLTRTNGIVQYVHAMDEGQHILANICKDGNIHFYTLDAATDSIFNQCFSIAGLHFLDAGRCYEPFGKAGRITNRRATV